MTSGTIGGVGLPEGVTDDEGVFGARPRIVAVSNGAEVPFAELVAVRSFDRFADGTCRLLASMTTKTMASTVTRMVRLTAAAQA